MKFLRTFLIVATVFAAGSLRANQASEAFKRAVEDNFFELLLQPEPTSDSQRVRGLREMGAKFRALKSDGLPADLKIIGDKLVTALTRLEEIAKAFPQKPEEIDAFASDPRNSEIMEKVAKDALAWQKEVCDAGEKFDQISKKYGLQPLFVEGFSLLFFKKELAEIKSFADSQEKAALKLSQGQKGLPNNDTQIQSMLAAKIFILREIGAKYYTVKTTGLPADLKAFYDRYAGIMGKVKAVFKIFPEKPEEIEVMLRTKAGRTQMEESFDKLATIRAELKTHYVELNGLELKYGFSLLRFNR